jgi:Tfp pilus assembly protein PilV
VKRPQPTSSFTLVEVVIALGLIAFAMVAVLSFFPAGLSSNRASITDTRAAQLARAIAETINSQCATTPSGNSFTNVNCFGLTLDLASLNTTAASHVLYASYPSPNQPYISSASTADSIYTIELRFDNDPALTQGGVKLGGGKLSLIEIRIFGKARGEGPVEFSFLARNKDA